MTKFVRLTDSVNRMPFYVVISKIIVIREAMRSNGRTFTLLTLGADDDLTHYAKETPEQIIKLIEEAET